MKKMMMMIAAVAVAGMAQAASFNWSATAGLNSLNPVLGDAGYGSSSAYVMIFSVADGFTAANGQFDVSTLALSGGVNQSANITIGGYNYAVGNIFLTYTEDQGTINRTYALVFYDPTTPSRVGIDVFAFTGLTNVGSAGDRGLGNFDLGAGAASFTTVPEPTSMALLALGVAAVGLRRKFRK